ncbi:MAG: DUF3291 domain-containing protein [Pseudomonadota bacterium]
MIGQFNIARARWDLDDPRMKPFFDAVPLMNKLAERSPGFVWRLVDDTAVMAEHFADEPRMTMTLSVWRDVESLRHFTWNTLHKKFRLRTAEWFEPPKAAYLAIWPIAEGHRPTGREAVERLEALRRNGPSDAVFGTEWLSSRPELSEALL